MALNSSKAILRVPLRISSIVRDTFEHFDTEAHRLDVDQAVSYLSVFGYSQLEARFLYLVMTHSGYFTRQQFLKFTGKTKGWAVHRFTQKLLARGHAKVTPLLHKTFLFRLCCRQMYDDLERPDLRIRIATTPG